MPAVASDDRRDTLPQLPAMAVVLREGLWAVMALAGWWARPRRAAIER